MAGMDREASILFNRFNLHADPNLHASLGALALEHGHDTLRGAVTEELSQGLLVIGNTMLMNKIDEVVRGVAGQGRLGEMRVVRKEVFWSGVEIGEVASSAAGDKYFPSNTIRVIEKENAPAALRGFDGAHQAGSTGSEDDDVGGLHLD